MEQHSFNESHMYNVGKDIGRDFKFEWGRNESHANVVVSLLALSTAQINCLCHLINSAKNLNF